MNVRISGDQIESKIIPTARKNHPCRSGSTSPTIPMRIEMMPTMSTSVRLIFFRIGHAVYCGRASLFPNPAHGEHARWLVGSKNDALVRDLGVGHPKALRLYTLF